MCEFCCFSTLIASDNIHTFRNWQFSPRQRDHMLLQLIYDCGAVSPRHGILCVFHTYFAGDYVCVCPERPKTTFTQSVTRFAPGQYLAVAIRGSLSASRRRQVSCRNLTRFDGEFCRFRPVTASIDIHPSRNRLFCPPCQNCSNELQFIGAAAPCRFRHGFCAHFAVDFVLVVPRGGQRHSPVPQRACCSAMPVGCNAAAVHLRCGFAQPPHGFSCLLAVICCRSDHRARQPTFTRSVTASRDASPVSAAKSGGSSSPPMLDVGTTSRDCCCGSYAPDVALSATSCC
jgi:hypothetical protein